MSVSIEKGSRRSENRERRRDQLISATIRCISRKGISGTTMANVASVAGLSQGIVNLHFETKDNLLSQTLQFLADEYKALFEKTLEKSGPGASGKLLALMQLDLRPSVCDRQKLAVWFAFWGEAKAVPTYQKICAEHDVGYDEVVSDLCAQIIRDGGYDGVTAEQVTDALSSMTDGLWLSCLIHPKTWNRHAAMSAVYSYLQSVFPGHYPMQNEEDN